MSALPPKADIERHDWHVCFVPFATECSAASPRLFDHLIGAGCSSFGSCAPRFGFIDMRFSLHLPQGRAAL